MKRLLLVLFLFLLAGCSLPVTPPEPSPTVTETAAPTETPLPELLFTPPSLPPTVTPTFGPTPTATLGPEYFHGGLWYDVDFVSQDGLRFKGTRTKAGCTAAALQMLLDFWHSYDPDYPTLSAQEIINRNTSRFDPKTGLNILDTVDDLSELGYFFGMRQNSCRQDLLDALERFGPVLLLTRTNWIPTGANHMALLTGYDPQRDVVRVMDPWQEGGVAEFSYDAFDGIWGLNYTEDPTDPLMRTFFYVIPLVELRPEGELFSESD